CVCRNLRSLLPRWRQCRISPVPARRRCASFSATFGSLTARERGTNAMAEAYIVAAQRTAGGRKGGRLKDWHPADLAAQVLDALVAKTGADPALIDDVIMGCVGQAGEQASNIARNAVLA